ncbi:MAG: hypothetical protein H0U59_11070 [Gemmatimonadaceae bacterium]|nr:hypothetical protein [Gemmatimonadaceae bacterium]
MRYCQRCGTKYDDRRSMAELHLTYCSLMCERNDMVPISQLLRAVRDTHASQLTTEERALLAELADSWAIEEAGG